VRDVYLKKGVRIQLTLMVVFFSLVACDFLSDKPKKIEFSDNSFAVIMPASWSLRSDLNAGADLQMGNSYKEAYVIIISDNKMDLDDLSLEEHSDRTRPFIKEGLKNCRESGPEYMNNGSFPILRYRLTGSFKGVNVIYWHVTLETEEHYHQIVLWSLKSKFSQNEADFNAVIQSFEVKRGDGAE
jgi:hypothetical protein